MSKVKKIKSLIEIKSGLNNIGKFNPFHPMIPKGEKPFYMYPSLSTKSDTIEVNFYSDKICPSDYRSVTPGKWFILYSLDDIVASKDKLCKIPLGISIDIPKGFSLYGISMCSEFTSKAIEFHIDPDSTGQWVVSIKTPEDRNVKAGTQLIAVCIQEPDIDVKFSKIDIIEETDKTSQSSNEKTTCYVEKRETNKILKAYWPMLDSSERLRNITATLNEECLRKMLISILADPDWQNKENIENIEWFKGFPRILLSSEGRYMFELRMIELYERCKNCSKCTASKKYKG